jgi:hypothetical protein
VGLEVVIFTNCPAIKVLAQVYVTVVPFPEILVHVAVPYRALDAPPPPPPIATTHTRFTPAGIETAPLDVMVCLSCKP